MEFAFTEEQLEMRDAVRDALEGECTPEAVRAAWEAPADALWTLLAELGVLGMTLPESVGGLELAMIDQILLIEEAGRAAFPGPLIETVAVGPALVEAGKTALAEAVVTGASMVTLAGPEGFAADADRCAAVLQVTDDGVGLLVDPQLTALTSVDGARRLFAVTGTVEPLDCDVEGLRNRAALATAAHVLGAGRKVLDLAVDYAKERRQFGKAIGSFQAVQHHLSNALMRLSFAAPLVHRAAWSMSHPSADTAIDVSMACSSAGAAAELACRTSLQVHGAIGYTYEYDLHLWMKRVWALRAAWGSGAQHRARVGRAIFGGADA
jgi:alkylation response protein AidB-like acyl-CoA dehydrogenase